MDNIRVFDNGGKTFDRYTVIIDQYVFTMSENACSPQGINMFAGELSELDSEAVTAGQPVMFEDLPKEVRKAIDNRIND